MKNPNKQNCEVYFVGNEVRMALLGIGTTHILAADDIDEYAIGILALGDKLATVETKGFIN